MALAINTSTFWGTTNDIAGGPFTSSAFDAPAGSLIVVALNEGHDTVATINPTIADNKTLTWTPRVSVTQASQFGVVRIWTAPVASAQTGIIVTLDQFTNVTKGFSAAAWVVTGQAASPIGASATQDTNGGTAVATRVSVNVQATGSLVFGAFQAGASVSNLVADSSPGTTLEGTNHFSGSGSSSSVGRLTSVTAATGATNVGATNSDQWAMSGALEIKSAAGGGGSGLVSGAQWGFGW